MMSLLPSRTRLYVNGFPKSGLHLADLWACTVLEPEQGGANGHWFGTFDGQAWKTEASNLQLVDRALDSIQPGHYLKGHMGWSPELARAFRERHIGLVFVYRDLRDVVVSQAYHVIDPDVKRLKHPGKALYQALPSFEDVLIACIEGIGDYPGIFERWELYAGWLLEPWTLHLRFDEMVKRPFTEAKRLAQYCYNASGMRPRGDLLKAVSQRMLVTGRQTSKSPTFRKGVPGAWKREYTPRVKACFKQHDPGWLTRLGFVKDNDW